MNTRHDLYDSDLRLSAVVVAAGQSRRMEGIDKIFYELKGVPLVWHSISAMQAHPCVREIALVTSKAGVALAEALVAAKNADSVIVCEGGQRRQDSVRIGLERLADCDYVVVHDGARPFIDANLLNRGISAALKSGAAIAAVPVKDTIKQSDDGLTVSRTLPRDELWAIQTPQIFRASLLKQAHERVSSSVTDDASMVEAIGHEVRLFLGSYYNIKVTTPEDLVMAQAISELGSVGGGESAV